MHEFHLIKDMFADLLKLGQEQKAKKMTRIYLRLGVFTEINEDILLYYFKEYGSGTILENAEIEIEKSNSRELSLVSFDCE